ncbi:MAG: hypothetical protein JWP18_2173 [Solirubrobacterales bacterium]|jgi:hypothetical protein|nr:hypothetical protein [Solirubrobacterales bacterium]
MAQRISIGFHASPPVNLRVSEDELAKLQAAIGSDGWHQISADDGDVKLNLQHVLWLKVDKEEQRVGFGLS